MAQSISRPPRLLCGPQGGISFEDAPCRTESLGCLGSEGRPEVVPAAFGPKLAFVLGEFLEQQGSLSAEVRLAPDVLCALDHRPVAFFAGFAEGCDEVFALGHGVGQSFPERSLPDPELEPFKLLARNGVLGQRGDPILKVESTQSLMFAPHGDPVAGEFPGEVVDQDQPPRLTSVDPAYSNVHTIPTTAPAGTMR